MRLLAVALLLASATAAAGQTQRNGDIYNGLNHQPTQAEVARREDRAGAEAPPAHAKRNARTVRQLDRKLLREEAAPLPRDPVHLSPP